MLESLLHFGLNFVEFWERTVIMRHWREACKTHLNGLIDDERAIQNQSRAFASNLQATLLVKYDI